jgi:PAS domain S-box-containing protein
MAVACGRIQNWMLRKKTLLIISATLLGLILLLYVTFNSTLLNGFLRLEDQDVRLNVSRLLNYITTQVTHLELQIQDWAHWTDTYEFVQDGNETYIENNLFPDAFQNLRLNLMVFVNNDHEIVYAVAYDLVTAEPLPVPPSLMAYLREHDRLLQSADGEHGSAGLLVLDDLPMLVASSPILNSSMDGEPRGTLIWGQYLDAHQVEALSALMRMPVTLISNQNASLPEDFRTIAPLLSVQSPIRTSIVDDNVIAGYGVLTDLEGEPTVLARLDMPREIYHQGLLSLQYFMLSLLAVGLVFGTLVLVLLERLVLSRVSSLSRSVRNIAVMGGTGMRLAMAGTDELTDLTNAINAMLHSLEGSQNSLQELNQKLEQRVIERTSELERQKTFLEAILDSMNDGVIYGNDRQIEYVNRMMVAMSGYELGEMVGQAHDFLFTTPVTAEKVGEPHDGRWVLRGERKLRRQDGTQVEIAYTITPLKGIEGEARNIYIIRDVTEEKVLQAHRDRFLAHAAHELRTPLTNLMTRLYLLRRQRDQFDTHINVLDGVVSHMRSLVEDLLDISRFKRGTIPLKRERLSLQPLIEDTVAVQQEEAARKQIRVYTQMPREPVEIFADPKRIVQILTNLVINAVHYTPAGGRIDVILDIEARDGKRFALLRVRDTGIGMDDESLSQIFQPFFRASTDTPGTGLGLSIVKEIVEQHGGDISVTSRPGEGSTFIVALLALTSDAREAGSARGQIKMAADVDAPLSDYDE